VAAAIARLGGASAFIGAVGSDPLGRFLQQTLSDFQVDIGHMHCKPDTRTSLVLVDLDDSGERSFTFMVRPSADQFLEQTDLPAFSAGQWLHTCSIALANEPVRSTTLAAMERAKAAGARISFDPNIRPDVWADQSEIRPLVEQALKLADVVKLSDDELSWLTGCDQIDAGLDQLRGWLQAELVVVTAGAEGCLFDYRGERRNVPTIKVTTVDTTGAGDAFVGGMLFGLANHDSWPDANQLEEILKVASACGALTATEKGAMSALPTLQQLQAFAADYLQQPAR